MIKQRVDASVYDDKYYAGRYQNIDYRNLERLGDFGHIYQKAGSMLQPEEQDKIVDFGCGIGHLSFYLFLKYKCDVTGVDYSQDALFLCEKNLKLLEARIEYSSIREKVRFVYFNINNPPNFKNIKAVFLIDVVEHLYDHELKLVLGEIKKWGGKNGIQIIIHTDNNNYLKFIRPILDFLAVCFKKNTYQKLNKGYAEVAKGHVNLTTAGRLKRKLVSHNFRVLKIEYPLMNTTTTKNQLGPIAQHWFVLYPIIFFGKILYFLRPSFYVLAENKETFQN
ncbi:MAG: hypothetical protein UX02_C0003G0061 [Candidatus Moranbacteria bacterium GW2011_GWC1_45_18]|nr:MAG: hypothetical protein UT79_C0004G0061 [Candidatus Moranbacteria bacterium GW2011_GWC2_40_12]KKT33673.1 MAG: hypothetical protein UW19_C0007G0064 [Candidatus Moranbacteria bacterium GW2011_GWF2_44_10]KKT71588.1 MAG: hypothetical protein UW66_C0027G0010 [Candidatus Moranbacteria bacterium GW2011_GWF1_44_4]KKT99518.1 MAG: hypothetical protein UX02_C0003G0061 [Candidatus Moranbacteria bacterium GW2011_GWC1_45_18]